MAVNSDSSELKQLGQSSSFYDEGIRQYDGDILDWSSGRSGSVLMAREYVPEAGKIGTRFIRTKTGLGWIWSIRRPSRHRLWKHPTGRPVDT